MRCNYLKGKVNFINEKDIQINDRIRDPEVRVIGPTGEQLGIMSSREAYNKAAEMELDLVKISPNANPPVCKIIADLFSSYGESITFGIFLPSLIKSFHLVNSDLSLILAASLLIGYNSFKYSGIESLGETTTTFFAFVFFCIL